MFRDALWESKSYSKTIVNFIALPMVFAALAVFFICAYFKQGLIGIITAAVIIVVMLVVLAACGRNLRWHNAKLVFAFDQDGILFGTLGNNSSYFEESYANIAGYDYKLEPHDLATVTIYFTVPASAGIYGKLKSLQMVKVTNFVALQQILVARHIARKN